MPKRKKGKHIRRADQRAKHRIKKSKRGKPKSR